MYPAQPLWIRDIIADYIARSHLFHLIKCQGAYRLCAHATIFQRLSRVSPYKMSRGLPTPASLVKAAALVAFHPVQNVKFYPRYRDANHNRALVAFHPVQNVKGPTDCLFITTARRASKRSYTGECQGTYRPSLHHCRQSSASVSSRSSCRIRLLLGVITAVDRPHLFHLCSQRIAGSRWSGQ